MAATARTPTASILVLALTLAAAAPATPAAAQATSSVGAAPIPAGDQALIEAAQRQDIAEVRRLLDQGADIEARSRYGASALSFAVDKGNRELVALLLERGADVNVKDHFYNFTPTVLAMMKATSSPAHREVLVMLIRKGVDDADSALLFGVQAGDLEIIETALATNKVTARGKRAALADAENRGVARIVERMRSAAPAETEIARVTLAPEALAAFAGEYKNEQIGMTIRVFLEGEEIKAQASGQNAFALEATSETEMVARDIPDIALAFSGRAGTIERFVLTQGGQELLFSRVDGSPMTLAAAEPADAPAPAAKLLPRPPRTTPQNWPSFRGPGASGIGDGQGAPTEWNATTGKNLRWKQAIPGIALSSPIVWGDRVFVSTAVGEGADTSFRTGLYGDVDSVEDQATYRWIVLALDKATGRVLWERTASEGKPKVKRHLKSSHANPTPVTDGRHVVVSFGSEGLFCYDFDGNLLWKRDLGVLSSGWFYDPTYEWGFSSSPVVAGGKVIVQVDIQKGSFLGAFDVATGEPVWRTDRDEIPTWGTPAVVSRPNGGEIVTNGTTIRGYDLETGTLLWTLAPNSEVTVATPVVADGLVYVTANYPPVRPIYAIKPGGRGDISLAPNETRGEWVAWSIEPGGVYIPTPIVYQGILYALQMNGRLTAYDAKTGETLYRERVGSADSYSGSSVAADGRLYFTTEEGTTYVVQAGREFALLSSNEVGEVVMTTPAISDGLLLVRGLHHLYAFSESTPDDD